MYYKYDLFWQKLVQPYCAYNPINIRKKKLLTNNNINMCNNIEHL